MKILVKKISQRLTQYPKNLEYTFLYVCFGLPIILIFGLTGLLKKGTGYWNTVLPGLLAISGVFLYLVIREYILYKKDRTAQKKLVGKVAVIKKLSKKNDTVLYTSIPQLKKIDLYNCNLFESIEIGDELYVEVSKFSKTIFKLEKNGVSLLNGR